MKIGMLVLFVTVGIGTAILWFKFCAF